jgi:hypothetical protein
MTVGGKKLTPFDIDDENYIKESCSHLPDIWGSFPEFIPPLAREKWPPYKLALQQVTQTCDWGVGIDCVDWIAPPDLIDPSLHPPIVKCGLAEVAQYRNLIRAVEAGEITVLDSILHTKLSRFKPNGEVPINAFISYVSQFQIEVDLNSTDTQLATQVKAQRGLPSGKISIIFADLYYSEERWRKNLGAPSNWLKECKIYPGSTKNKTPSLWNPVDIAIRLNSDHRLTRQNIPLKKLDAVFVGLQEWQDEWQSQSEALRE